jgi:hypothetical protein
MKSGDKRRLASHQREKRGVSASPAAGEKACSLEATIGTAIFFENGRRGGGIDVMKCNRRRNGLAK